MPWCVMVRWNSMFQSPGTQGEPMRVYAHLPMPGVPLPSCHLAMQNNWVVRCPRPRTTLPTPTNNVAHGRGQRRPRPWATNKVSSWNGGKAYEIGFVDICNQIPYATLSPSSTVTLLEIDISHASEIISWNRTLCFLKNRRYKRFGYMFSLLTHKKCT